MMSEILAMGMPGGFEWLIIIILAGIFFVLPVVAIVMIIRYIVRSNAEKRRLRMEVGKLADEIEQLRKSSGQK
jgi:hypothetical protein